MHTCESVTDELLGYESKAVAVTLFSLVRREGPPVSDAIDRVSGKIGDASGQITCAIPVVRATRRVGRVLGDAGRLQCLVVVVRRVAATMTHDNGMIHWNFVQIRGVQFALVFYLGVVEEVAFDPY